MSPLAALHDKEVVDMTIRASKHTTLALLFIRAINKVWILFSPILVLLVDMYFCNYISVFI
jgi:exosome complex RNA-binding protein Rrp42 (RNase PH superfamily)